MTTKVSYNNYIFRDKPDIPEYLYKERRLEIINWCAKNTKPESWVHSICNNYILFENQSDAVAFKLRFGL